MTNEEAIKGLKNVSTMFTGYKPNEEMFAMAIKALETVSCIKEKCAYCPHCENCDVDDETLEIKALEQQPCETTVINEYRNRLMDAFHNADCDELIAVVVRPEESEFKQLEWLLKNHYHNQKQQPCDDAISRKDMLAVFRQSNSLSQAWNGFEKLPPITPKEKTGHWIERKLPMMIHDWKCDQCRMVTNERTNFCPNCGARMVSEWQR